MPSEYTPHEPAPLHEPVTQPSPDGHSSFTSKPDDWKPQVPMPVHSWQWPQSASWPRLVAQVPPELQVAQMPQSVPLGATPQEPEPLQSPVEHMPGEHSFFRSEPAGCTPQAPTPVHWRHDEQSVFWVRSAAHRPDPSQAPQVPQSMPAGWAVKIVQSEVLASLHVPSDSQRAVVRSVKLPHTES